MGTSARVTGTSTPWRVEIDDGTHRWSGDEPAELGGGDTAPTPFQLLCSSLGACTAITVQMYAARKQWPLAGISVRVVLDKAADGANVFTRSIVLEGALDDEQRARLLDIANKCPTHRLLTGTIRIESALVPA